MSVDVAGGKKHPDHVETEWGWMPAPKFCTPRDHSFASRGPRQTKFAEVWLRQPKMPWQKMVGDIFGEVHPDGRPRYKLGVVTVQRQAGKSHETMSRKAEKCFSVPNTIAWYTAQTGGDARDQFLKFGEQIEGTPLGKVTRTLIGNGRELMRFPNQSQIRPHPPTEKALHGKQSDDNDIDEAWAFEEDEGKALLQAIGPTQLTRPFAQTAIWSAGGTAASTWLAQLVARGRGGDPEIFYCEFGIPDDADADDLDVIAAHHPAFGHTVSYDALRGLYVALDAKNDPAGWARAAGNRWSEVIGGAFSDALWQSVRTNTEIPDGVPVGYGTARAIDGSEVAVVAAGLVDGKVIVEVLDVMPAHDAARHVDDWTGDGPLATSPDGSNANLAAGLANIGRGERTPLLQLGSRDYAAACQNLDDALPQGAVLFRPHPALDAAAKVAGKRSIGDGGWVWSRVAAGASIATIEAATYAVWALGRRPAQLGPPVLRFREDVA